MVPQLQIGWIRYQRQGPARADEGLQMNIRLKLKKSSIRLFDCKLWKEFGRKEYGYFSSSQKETRSKDIQLSKFCWIGSKGRRFFTVITSSDKWVYYDNSKRKKSRVNPGQPITSIAKSNMHWKGDLLCIWCDQRHGVLRAFPTRRNSRWQSLPTAASAVAQSTWNGRDDKTNWFSSMITQVRMSQNRSETR